MRFCVHFTLQDLLGALHCQRGNLATQFFAHATHTAPGATPPSGSVSLAWPDGHGRTVQVGVPLVRSQYSVSAQV